MDPKSRLDSTCSHHRKISFIELQITVEGLKGRAGVMQDWTGPPRSSASLTSSYGEWKRGQNTESVTRTQASWPLVRRSVLRVSGVFKWYPSAYYTLFSTQPHKESLLKTPERSHPSKPSGGFLSHAGWKWKTSVTFHIDVIQPQLPLRLWLLTHGPPCAMLNYTGLFALSTQHSLCRHT